LQGRSNMPKRSVDESPGKGLCPEDGSDIYARICGPALLERKLVCYHDGSVFEL